MALLKRTEYTIDDIYALPDGQRAELIDGQLFMMAPPSRIHQDLLMELSGIIREFIKAGNGGCKIYPAPFAVFLTHGTSTYVEPDISIICDKRKLDDKGCHGAPDWILEIVSPGSQRMDYLIKLLKYRSAGVREYWIVDPRTKAVAVYNFEADDMHCYTFDDKIPSGIYPGFEIDFSGLDLA